MLLAALGFSGCGKNILDNPGQPDMYGTPTATFSVKGKVTDTDGRPIAGIAVSIRDAYYRHLTDAEGVFVISNESAWPSERQTLRFEDIDGPLHGEFMAKEVEVEFTKSGEGDGGWYAGSYVAPDMEVRLEASAQHSDGRIE